MEDEYEYRRAPSKGAFWLAVMGVIVLLLFILYTDAFHLMWLVWVFAAFTVAWMLSPKTIYGIKIDADYLVLAAWRNPRYILLKDIAYLRGSDISEETKIAIVFKSGEEEGIFDADLPDVDTLVTELGERGVPVRDVY
jgi:hypothetical protein